MLFRSQGIEALLGLSREFLQRRLRRPFALGGLAALAGRRRQPELQRCFAAQQRPHQRVRAKAQAAVGVGVAHQVALGLQLAEQEAPLAAIQLLADAIHAELAVLWRGLTPGWRRYPGNNK